MAMGCDVRSRPSVEFSKNLFLSIKRISESISAQKNTTPTKEAQTINGPERPRKKNNQPINQKNQDLQKYNHVIFICLRIFVRFAFCRAGHLQFFSPAYFLVLGITPSYDSCKQLEFLIPLCVC